MSAVRIASVNACPIESCAGIAVGAPRFDSDAPRASSRARVGAAAGRPVALTRFSDGFPILVASFCEVDAFEEDAIDTLTGVATDGPAARLRLVEPCARRAITELDPAAGRHERGALLAPAAFCVDARLGSAVTFGWNAIVADGLDGALRVGDPIEPVDRWG